MNISIIGGADGPTSILVADNISKSWINIFGLFIVVLMLLPNIIYAIKVHNIENKCKNKIMNSLEQIGRYSSMFLMAFNIGIAEFGFSAATAFVIYYIGNIILLITYWLLWILFFKKRTLWISMSLAIIPTAIFLLSGITLRHYLLLLSAVIFGIGHVYVTYQNAKQIN